ncbi:tetratricopeptide repeat protein [Streptomyces sp. ISL-10]|uniref:AfsR/SARP family transcriptional regulator n=1 Tax=Streptomyces sp. ISL-10 TaxID=2819172 RepID=UPI001BE65A7B|nr:BTAD domain-containing putative transcriptional regulator [Streptomyces sp. ISL-10]MBT2364807.1 tetratricopeptide repeat protein [Streptomyces sp. ISL-10]
MGLLSFKMLGPLAVEADGVPIPLGGLRQRTVLAVLLLSPGRPVPVDALIEAVWQGAPPATARNQIAICITTLRRIFRDAAGDDRLITTGHRSYVLNQGEHDIDVRTMDRLVAEARALARDGHSAQAMEIFRQALALWNGTALEGLSGGRIDAAAARLSDLWLDVSEEYAGLQLQLGDYRSVVAHMTGVVDNHPLREQARFHLMLALRRSGRRASALETYRAGRKIFIEQLGTEPGPALQELHQRILQDLVAAEMAERYVPPTSPVTGIPAQLPAPSAAFTGRTHELAELDQMLDVSRSEAPLTIAALSGTSGVGKTALAVHWANSVAERFADGQLFVDMRGYDDHEPPLTAMQALDRCLRALGVPSSHIPDELEERAALYRGVLDGKRVLILLDNVRSLRQALPLFPGRGTSCVVVTGRDSFDYMTGDYAVVRIALKSLEAEQSSRLLATIAGSTYTEAAPEQAARLVELCDGLPLALRIAGAYLVARPHRSVAQLVDRLEDRCRRLDILSPREGGVRAGIWLSYRELPAEAARLYRLLGLLPVRDFAAWSGAAVLDTSTERAEDLLEQLVEAQLLNVRPGASGSAPRFEFHSLLRLFAWERAEKEESPEEREAALGRAFGAWLSLADRANELLRGPGHVTPLRGHSAVLSHWSVTEEPLTDPIAWFESERHAITDLVRHWGETDNRGRPWELVARTVPLFETYNYLEDWRTTADIALRAARRTGDEEGIGTMLSSLGTLEIYRRNYQEARSVLMDAKAVMEQGDDAHGYAMVLRNLALCTRFAGDLDEAAGLCRQAVDFFKRTEDVAGRSHAVGLLAQIEIERGERELGFALIREAFTINRDNGSLRGETQNLYRLAEALLQVGEVQEAEQAGHEVVVLSRAQGDRLGEAHGLRVRGEAQWRQRMTDEAEASLRQAHLAASEVGDSFLRARVELDLACTKAVESAAEQARAYAEAALATLRGLANPHWERRAERLHRFLTRALPGTSVAPARLVRAFDA